MKKTILFAFVALTIFLSFTTYSINLAEEETPRPTSVVETFI